MRIVFSGNRATGLEVESGGERFLVEGDQITLCAGAVGSPQLLMLSGIGPRDQLAPLDIPVVVDAPGVGQNMRDHPNVVVRFTVNEDRPDETVARRALRLRYTATASPTPNDMILSPSSLNTVVKEDVDPTHSINCGLYLAVGKGELRLVSTDPNVQPSMDYHYLEEPWDRERLREAIRKCVTLLEDGAYGEIVNQRTAPTDADLSSDESLDEWMLRTVSTSFHISGTCKMGVAGDSAGGNLAAVTAQVLRDEGRPLAAQLLIYPVTDSAGSYPSHTENAEGYFLDTATMAWFGAQYAGDAPDLDPADPRLSPLHGRLDGLAPAVVVTAELDPLRDDGNAYARALEEAGVPVQHRVFPGMVHGFVDMGRHSEAADRAVDETLALFRPLLHP